MLQCTILHDILYEVIRTSKFFELSMYSYHIILAWDHFKLFVKKKARHEVVISMLILCILGTCRLLIFFKTNLFKKKSSMNTIVASNSLEPDQARPPVGPDPVPNCLQNLSAYDTNLVG